MTDVTIDPIPYPFAATITPPGSKSLTNRALVLAALAAGTCDITNVLVADDTEVMLDSLARLGFRLEIDHETSTVRVHGRGGRIDMEAAELFCGNSGTTIRFLTALCALGHGRFTLDGIARMRQRPIGALTELLKTLGARVGHSPGADGFPPVHLDADGLAGGSIRYGSEVSSQYLSAVLMVAPYARSEVRVDLAPNQTSWPYVAMTLQLMERFGVTPALARDAATGHPSRITVPCGTYAATRYTVEPDASNASYFLAAAAINPAAKITTLEGVDVDLAHMPDMAQTLAVVALFATGRSTIRGLHTLRVKETDRVAALSAELTKLGAAVDVAGDALTITPPPDGRIAPASIATYDDHRMAMSFAVAGTRARGVTIRDIECVTKTYPRFFDDLKRVTTTG